MILNSYNQGRYLDAAIRSVLAQSFSSFELLIVDNGSTDDSAQIARGHLGDTRVRVVAHESNAAVSRRFNEAVSAARGEFVSFLYSDDEYLPSKLQREVEALDRMGSTYGVAYGPILGFNESTSRRWVYGSPAASGDVFDILLRRSIRGQMDMIGPLIRRECLELHKFDETVFAEGEAIFFRIALTHKFVFIAEPVAVMRDHGTNAGKAIKRNREMFQRAMSRLASDPRLTSHQRTLVSRCEAGFLRNYGWQAMRVGGDPAWARDCIQQAVALSPREALHPRTWGTLALLATPEAIRGRLNRLGHRLSRTPRTPQYVADYEGLDN